MAEDAGTGDEDAGTGDEDADAEAGLTEEQKEFRESTQGEAGGGAGSEAFEAKTASTSSRRRAPHRAASWRRVATARHSRS